MVVLFSGASAPARTRLAHPSGLTRPNILKRVYADYRAFSARRVALYACLFLRFWESYGDAFITAARKPDLLYIFYAWI